MVNKFLLLDSYCIDFN